MIPPLVPVALAFLIGILLAWSAPLSLVFLLSAGLVCSVGALVWRKRHWLGFVIVVFLWLCVGALRTISWQHQPAHHVAHLVAGEPTPSLVHGVVVDDPVELFAPGEPERQVAVIQTRHIRTEEGWPHHLPGFAESEPPLRGSPLASRQVVGWRSVTGLMRARLRDPRVRLAYGDEVLLEGRWSSVPSPGNPGQYDWQAALARQRIHALLSVEPFHGVVRLQPGHGSRWFRAIYALRHRLERLIDAHFSAYHAGLLRSLLLGQRVALDEDLKQAFINTGTMHLLVISGFNVGLIAGLLELLFRIIGFPFRLRLVLSSLGLFGYCVLTGMQAPVTRATIMAWVVLGALWLDRVINWPNTLAAAALAILWFNPAQLFDAGFQLSFGAVLSLLVFTARFRSVVEPRLRIRPEWLRRYVAISLASTIAIWVGLWPLLAWYFHLISPVSVLANLALVPLVSVLVTSGTVLLMVGTVVASVVSWTGGVLESLVDLTVGCVRWCHQIPWGFWPVGHPSWLVIGGYYGLVTIALIRRPFRLRPGWVIACWLAGMNLWLWSELGARLQASRWLEVTILDVGHGDSIVVRTPSHHTLLIDTGTQDAGRYTVVPFLRFRGFHTLDALVITHPDEDHLGGALPLLHHLQVKRLLTNGSPGLTTTARQAMDLVKSKRLRHERIAAGVRLTGAVGIDMMVLHPPPTFVPGTEPSSNDNSVVIKVTNGDVSLLLCGDLEAHGLPWLLAWGHQLSATVLKVPHHGSALGVFRLSFLEWVRPSVAVISVGRRHDLPARSVLSDLVAVGAQVFLTRRDGAVTIRTDGKRLLVKTYR